MNIFNQPTHKIRRVLLITLAIMVVCLIAALLFTYWYVPMSENRSLSFQAYAPQKLPAGVHVTGHSTTVRYGGIVKYVTFTTNLTGFNISEQKMSMRDYTGTFGSCNFNRATSSCLSFKTPQKSAYHVLAVTDNHGTPSLQTVYWYRNGTELEFNLLGPQAHQYAPSSWGPLIDSFTPVNYGYDRGSAMNDTGV